MCGRKCKGAAPTKREKTMARGTIPKKDGEEWRLIEGETEYYVSNLGRVRKNKKLLKMSINKDGYYACWIGKKRRLVHLLVAKAFIPNPENKKCVDHLDGDKTNNKYSENPNINNLRWVTHSENTQAAYDLGLIKRTEIVGIDELDRVVLYKTQADAARDLDIDPKTINQVIHGLLEKTKGWKFFRMREFEDKRSK